MGKTMVGAFFAMALLIVAQLPQSLASPSTAPAFLWSTQQDEFSTGTIKAVDYRTIYPRDLAKSVMSEGGWSNSLCFKKESSPTLDFAVLFVGKELQSRDLFGARKTDSILVEQLKVLFGNSNLSLAFPYVAASEENEAIESSLLSHFEETCENGVGIGSIAALSSCSLEGDNIEKLADISTLREYLALKLEKKALGPAHLIVVCHGGFVDESDANQPLSEVEIFSQLISSVKEVDAKYTFLYVADPRPRGSMDYKTHRELERLLAESTFGNRSVNSTCDGVCQIKSSLLEGILVGIVLLIILISGLCCMAGIDTPTRFEAPQDS